MTNHIIDETWQDFDLEGSPRDIRLANGPFPDITEAAKVWHQTLFRR